MRALGLTLLLAVALTACGRGRSEVIEAAVPVVTESSSSARSVPPPFSEVPPERPTPAADPTDDSFRIGRESFDEGYVSLQYRAYQQACAAAGVAPVGRDSYRQLLIDELLVLRASQGHPVSEDPVLLALAEAQSRRLIGDHYVQSVLFEGLEVSDAEIEAQYRATVGRYTESEQVRVSQIQFALREDAERFLQRITAGEDFTALAESLGLTVLDPGWFTRGQLDERIEQVAFALAIGEVSSVITTQAGHSVLLKVGSSPQRVQPLSEVADAIRADLLARRRQETLARFLAEQRRDQGIEGPPVLVP